MTQTLPEATLRRLARIDADISRLSACWRGGVPERGPRTAAEVDTIRGDAPSSPYAPRQRLKRSPVSKLVLLAHGRPLISFDQPRTIAELEVTLNDVLDDKRLALGERRVFEAIDAILRDARRSDDITPLRHSIMCSRRSAAAANPVSGHHRPAGAAIARPRPNATGYDARPP